MVRTSAKVAARERAREVRSRNAAATRERARRIGQLQTEFFEAEALREEAVEAVELHELAAARRVAALVELGLLVEDVAALLDTDAKAVRGLRNRANAAARTPDEVAVSTVRDVLEVAEPRGGGREDVGEVVDVAVVDGGVAALGSRG